MVASGWESTTLLAALCQRSQLLSEQKESDSIAVRRQSQAEEGAYFIRIAIYTRYRIFDRVVTTCIINALPEKLQQRRSLYPEL